MSIINSQPLIGASGQGGGYNLTKSLRFRSSASAYLNRTPASASNRRTWTWSAWVKRSGLGSAQALLAVNATTDYTYFAFNASDILRLFLDVDALAYAVEVPTVVWRDPSAWYHIILAMDTTQATAGNRVKIYVNGVQQTVSAISGYSFPAQNWDTDVNSTLPHAIGNFNYLNSSYFDGYMTEVNFIDGQALTPSSFGETSTSTGVWIPKKYTGTYGTNGFYLPFTDVATTSGSNAGLGKDFSGNGNYWTTNNISVTTGTTYDSMSDVPTLTSATAANYCTLNPVKKGTTNNPALSNGNLTYTAESSAAQNPASSTIGVSTGSWYYEATITNSGYNPAVGVADPSDNFGTGDNWRSYMKGVVLYGSFGGEQYVNGSYTGSTGYSFTTGDVMGIAFDASSGKVWVAKNNTWFNSGNPSAGTGQVATASSYSSLAPILDGTNNSGNKDTINANFGQRPFTYTPPTGFKALNTFNLPTPTIGATASSQANDYFDVSLYTGTGSTLAVTNSGSMQPDFVWIKKRSAAEYHALVDSVRGASKRLFSNVSDAEDNGGITSFNSNGFTTSNGNGADAENAATYVAWQWRASNTTAVTNTAGSITSTVSANTSAGFSVATYSANGSTGTVGHGLGVAPSMIIVKKRNASERWCVYHTSTSNAYIYLNETFAAETANAQLRFGNNSSVVQPSSTVFTIGSSNDVNGTSGTYVAYCFAEVAGYSAFGSYTGNNSSDGTFVYLGFRPKFIMIKSTSDGTEWVMVDSTRSTYNLVDTSLYANRDYSESTIGTVNDIDFLSNGFKLRNNTGYVNSSQTYIYMAFAESPFKFSNAR